MILQEVTYFPSSVHSLGTFNVHCVRLLWPRLVQACLVFLLVCLTFSMLYLFEIRMDLTNFLDIL